MAAVSPLPWPCLSQCPSYVTPTGTILQQMPASFALMPGWQRSKETSQQQGSKYLSGRVRKWRRSAAFVKLQQRICRDEIHADSTAPQWRRAVVVARLFSPADFDASKLTVRFEGDLHAGTCEHIENLLPRKYTLTHSDVTGELLLSVGPSYNNSQLTGWCTQLMRDEIVAEWRANGRLSLNVHCHVSGGHILLAPAALRNRIFQQEMPLVLKAIRYGDGALLTKYPELDSSTVWVHFHSSNPEYDRADCWGPLFYAASSMNWLPVDTLHSRLLLPVIPENVAAVEKDVIKNARLAFSSRKHS